METDENLETGMRHVVGNAARAGKENSGVRKCLVGKFTQKPTLLSKASAVSMRLVDSDAQTRPWSVTSILGIVTVWGMPPLHAP